jgi:hypothetical protein
MAMILRAGWATMQRRDFYFLLPTGLVLIGAVIVEMVLGGRGPIQAPSPKPVFPGLADHLDELAWVRISRGAAKIDLANVAGHWVVVEKDNYPAAPARFRRLLLGLAGLTLVEPDAPDAASPNRPGSDGLASGEPTRFVLRGRAGNTAADAAIAAVPVATVGGGADLVYVRKADADTASLARGSLELPGDMLDWLDRGIVDLPPARVAAVNLTAADGATLAIRRNSPDAAFAALDLPAGTRLKANAALSDLAAALAELEFDDVKPLALIEPPAGGFARAEFTTFDGLAIDLRLFTRDGGEWVAVVASGTGGDEAESNAINDRVARWTYAIPAARATLLRTRMNDLIEPTKGL